MSRINIRKYTSVYTPPKFPKIKADNVLNKGGSAEFKNLKEDTSNKKDVSSFVKKVKSFLNELTGEEHVVNPELLEQKIPKSTTYAKLQLQDGGTIEFTNKGKFYIFNIMSKCVTSAAKGFYDHCSNLCKEGRLNEVGMDMPKVGELQGVNDVIIVSPGKKPKVIKVTSHLVCEDRTGSQRLFIDPEKFYINENPKTENISTKYDKKIKPKKEARNFLTYILGKIQ